MEERQLTVEGETMAMPRPFLVIATQNPVELEGTFPLPEAQLDRFLLRLRMGYPDAAEEDAILLRFERAQPLEELDPVVESEQLRLMVKTVEQVRVSEAVRGYIVAIVQASREERAFELGASPRASLALLRTTRALAAIRGRDFVLPDDVQEMARVVLPHRLMLSADARLRSSTPESLARADAEPRARADRRRGSGQLIPPGPCSILRWASYPAKQGADHATDSRSVQRIRQGG